MADPDVEVGQSRIGGKNAGSLSSSRQQLSVDAQAISTLKRHLGSLADEAERLADALDRASKASGGIGGGGGNYLAKGSSKMPELPGQSDAGSGFASLRTGIQQFQLGKNMVSGGGGAGGAGGFASMRGAGAGGMAAGIAGAVVGVAGAALNFSTGRLDRNEAYALTLDQRNVQLQQLTGMSRVEVGQNMRQPLNAYRLGRGGHDAFMGFQAQTGYFDLPQDYARSVSGLRALSGYSLSTAEVLSNQQQLMNPEVANRMFFMGGVNAFTAGGQLNDPIAMRSQIVDRLGLNNPAIARSALMPGSVTRMRLADLGLDDAMQTEFIQYGLAQNSFRAAGGQGMYDPGRASHREIAGIEDNFATQREETGRLQIARQEAQVRDTLGGLAQGERLEQTLTRFSTAIDKFVNKIDNLVAGARPVTRAIGISGDGDGGAPSSAAVTPPSSKPMSPDDSSKDHEILVPSGDVGSRKMPLSEFRNTERMRNLHPTLRERLLRLMRVRPSIGITSGYRDESHQERLFLEQMEETDEANSETEWDGRYWKPKPGKPFTAAPGRSMHGIGLAADLFDEEDPSRDWLVQNSAQFGLNNWRAKGWRHDEPWHVQPDNVPRYRSDYTGPEWDPKGTASSSRRRRGRRNRGADSGPKIEGDMGHGGFGGITGTSITELMAEHEARGQARFLAGGRVSEGSRGARRRSRSTANKSSAGKVLTAEEIGRLALEVGWPEDEIANVIAVAYGESSFNSGAHNPHGNDNSYGLMQVNMLNRDGFEMGNERLKTYGLSSNEDLFDPATNLRVALGIWRGQGWEKGWTAYGGSNYNEMLPTAKNIAASLTSEAGDPAPSDAKPVSRAGGSTTNNFTSSPTVNVSPVINFNGSPDTPDLRSIAKTVSSMIKEEVEMLGMRHA